ncbi:PAS domain S-box protein [candidate division KSB1 bacterium]|nr:PAS domain S-box protein [candidate division KSB1 bacterium]
MINSVRTTFRTAEPVRILLVEDDREEYYFISRTLKKEFYNQFQLEWKCSLNEALEIIDHIKFDVILLDMGLPDSQGEQTFQTIHEQTPNSPIIILSNIDDADFALSMMQNGAQDYLVKGRFDGFLLFRSIQYARERKHHELILQQSEIRFKQAANLTTDLIYEWDILSEQIVWYGNIDAALDYSAGEFPRTLDAWLASIHPEDSALLAHVMRNYQPSDDIHSIEYRIRTKSGSWRYWQDKGKVILNQENLTYKILGACSDITQQKKNTESLKYQAALLKSTNDAVISTNMDLFIESWNKSAEKMYGWTEAEVLLKSIQQILQPEYPHQSSDYIRDYISRNESWQGEVVQKKKDGTPIHVWSSISQIVDSQGNPSSLVAINRDITQRKLAAETLAASERRYRLIVENLMDVIWTTNLNGTFTYVTPSVERLLGYSVQEVLTLPLKSLITPDSWLIVKDILASIHEHVHGKKKFSKRLRLEIEQTRKDGATIWTESTISVMYDEWDNFSGISGVTRDISERKKAREDLERLFNLSFDLICIIDFSGKLLRVNPAFGNAIGYSESELISRSFYEFIHPDDRAMTQKTIKQLKSENQMAEKLENRWMCKDNSIHWFDWIFFSEAKTKEFYAIARNVSERKQTEQDYQYKLRYESFISSILSIFINLDPMKIDKGINKVIAELGEFCGLDNCLLTIFSRNISVIDYMYIWQQHRHYIKYHSSRQSVVEFSWAMNHIKNGNVIKVNNLEDMPPEAHSEKNFLLNQPKPVQAFVILPFKYHKSLLGALHCQSSQPRIWTDDHIMLMRLVAELIANALEHKQTHLALKRSEQRFKTLFKEARTINEELEQSNSILKKTQASMFHQEKLASIGQLAAGVAHEMNNPLGFIMNNFSSLNSYIDLIKIYIQQMSELLPTLRNIENDELQTSLDEIEKFQRRKKFDFIMKDMDDLISESSVGFKRINSIIQSLRNFSRIDKLDDVESYDLNQGIEDTLTVARNEIKYAAEIDTDLGEIVPIKCNSGEINQVLLNIVVNAAQAIKSQQRNDLGKILIKTYMTDDVAVCEISDDGPGIPKHVLPKIFDPFFSTKKIGTGTGLGLNISYDIIVHKHAGELTVCSKPGKGTTFSIKIPVNCRVHKKDVLSSEKYYG